MTKIAEQAILITGATDGLGRRVAEDLAARGATVLLHGRSSEKGEAALAEIRRATKNDRLRYYNADFASLAEVRRLADTIAAAEPRLDVLVNNAGLGAGAQGAQKRETSRDGFELRLAVNYIAPFLLTRRLFPLLRRTASQYGEARIVNVASAAQEEIDFSDPQLEQGYKGLRAYAQSKLALVMFTFDLAEELAWSGISATVLHPASLMDTKMVREWFGTPRALIEDGARPLERLILSEELAGVSGEYFDQDENGKANPQAYDPGARRRLRELSLEWIAGFDRPEE